MSDAEIHRRESSAVFSLGEALEKAGMQPPPGGWLEGVLIDSKFKVSASRVFSEWLSEVVKNPSGQTIEEHLDRLKTALSPFLVEFQNSRTTHDFLEDTLTKAGKSSERKFIDDPFD